MFIKLYHPLLLFVCNEGNPAVPVCSQVSQESRWELVQRSCHLQLQTWVEKSDVRKSDASPRRSMRGMVGLEW